MENAMCWPSLDLTTPKRSNLAEASAISKSNYSENHRSIFISNCSLVIDRQ
jgi:hypothetical protein